MCDAARRRANARRGTEVAADVNGNIAHGERKHARVHASRPRKGDDPGASRVVAQHRIAVGRVVGTLSAHDDEAVVGRNRHVSQALEAVPSTGLPRPINSPVRDRCRVARYIDLDERLAGLAVDARAVVHTKHGVAIACRHDPAT